MESIWDYVYWQTLSINMFDERRPHRAPGPDGAGGQCSQLWNAPAGPNAEEQEIFERCNPWIGPDQPGINAPDFTTEDGGAADAPTATARPTSERLAATSTVDRRGAGEPEAPPIPARTTRPSRKFTLPPLIKDLIEKLAPRAARQLSPEQAAMTCSRQAPQLPDLSDPQASPETLLDFLLAP